MHRCPDDQADLLLDGKPWRFTTLSDAATTFVKLARYKGARFVNWPVTVERLHAKASAADHAWWERYSRRHERLLLALGQRVPVYGDDWTRQAGEDVQLPEEEQC